MQSNVLASIITKLVLAFGKGRAEKIDAAKEESRESLIGCHVRYTGFIKGFMIFGMLLFTGFGILSLYEKMYVAVVIFAFFAIASVLEAFYMFSFSVHYDGPVIEIRSIFGSKEFHRKDIRELSIDGKGGIRARFASGKIHVDEYCTGRQGFYDYLEKAFCENIDAINACKAAKLANGFWCKNGWAEILIMAFSFAVFAGLGIWLIPPEMQSGSFSLFYVTGFLAFMLFPIAWLIYFARHWIKVFPQEGVIYCYRLLHKKEIPFDSVLNLQVKGTRIFVSFRDKKGKTRKIKIYLSFTNAEYFLGLMAKEGFEKQ